MTLQNSSQYSFILASSLSRFGSPNEFWSRFSIAKARRLGKPWCNDLNIEKTYDHFIICGYGQVGRTVIEQLARLHIPFVLIETNEGFILNS
jgi:TrkA-N domain